MKNLIKTILSIFLFSFVLQNVDAAIAKPFILGENVRDTIGLEQKKRTL